MPLGAQCRRCFNRIGQYLLSVFLVKFINEDTRLESLGVFGLSVCWLHPVSCFNVIAPRTKRHVDVWPLTARHLIRLLFHFTGLLLNKAVCLSDALGAVVGTVRIQRQSTGRRPTGGDTRTARLGFLVRRRSPGGATRASRLSRYHEQASLALSLYKLHVTIRSQPVEA
jgi:hypothetical protein